MSRHMSIVAIGAHQDDIEVSCLGTLILYREHRHASVTHVTISNGELGGQGRPGTPPAEIAATRAAEAKAVADAIGARYVCLQQPDMYVRDTDEVRDRLVDVIREARADIVLAPPPTDYHLDHIAVSRLAFHATLAASVRSLVTDKPALPRTPALYYVDTVAGLDWEPSVYVDITRVFERKCSLIALHVSQMQAARAVGGWDLVRYSELKNGFRGLQSGVAYAEAFAPARAWPRLHAGTTDALPGPS
jgi:LmbE family N-acetylglucosaminyl deacetylase